MKNNNELEFELEFALAAKLVAEKKEFSKSLATRLEDFCLMLTEMFLITL